jgi:hypothetical protein
MRLIARLNRFLGVGRGEECPHSFDDPPLEGRALDGLLLSIFHSCRAALQDIEFAARGVFQIAGKYDHLGETVADHYRAVTAHYDRPAAGQPIRDSARQGVVAEQTRVVPEWCRGREIGAKSVSGTR